MHFFGRTFSQEKMAVYRNPKNENGLAVEILMKALPGKHHTLCAN